MSLKYIIDLESSKATNDKLVGPAFPTIAKLDWLVQPEIAVFLKNEIPPFLVLPHQLKQLLQEEKDNVFSCILTAGLEETDTERASIAYIRKMHAVIISFPSYEKPNQKTKRLLDSIQVALGD